ncbi:MAG: hypothetical protein V3V08_17960 [Nannocystaceae bacterium]
MRRDCTQRLRDVLLDVELDSGQLRIDPTGRTWLPAALRSEVERSAEARAQLARFVRTERELFDDARVATDPFFTARVVERLPASDVDHRGRRTLILATFHALAFGVAYVLVFPWLNGDASELPGAVHLWIESGAESGALWGLVLLFVLGSWLLGCARPDAPGWS